MTDDEVLLKWRRQYGRITLSQAIYLERPQRRFAHPALHSNQYRAENPSGSLRE